MIKIENGILYLTAGETCCIFKADENNALRRVHFGKRVEFEDDIGSLLGVRPECEGVNGAELKFASAEVLSDKPVAETPMLYGGKTLKIVLEDVEKGLRGELFVTPYSRGGFTRRITIENRGTKSVSFDRMVTLFELPEECDIVSVSAEGEIVCDKSSLDPAENGLNNFTAVLARGADDVHGDVYGFFSVFGDGSMTAECANGGATVACAPNPVVAGKIKLAAGQRIELPETLCVYSDRGLGGMSRVFHDILREYMTEKKPERRPPTVMFATSSDKKLCEAVRITSELGCDAFAVDISKVSKATLSKVVSKCKEVGVKSGIRVRPDDIEKNAAAFDAAYTEIKADGKYRVRDIAGLISTVDKLAVETELDYILIELPLLGVSDGARAMYDFRRRTSERKPEAIIEWGIAPRKSMYAESLCYPTSLMRTVVTARAIADGELKTEFDAASVGRLGYELDPLALDDSLKRAVRAQIFSYQDDAPEALSGDLYRLAMTGGNSMMFVSKDKSKAYAVCVPTDGSVHRVFLIGIDEHNLYHVREMDKTFSGAALISRGVTVGSANSFTLHLRQVADYE